MVTVQFFTEDAQVVFDTVVAKFPESPLLGDEIYFADYFPYHSEERKQMLYETQKNNFSTSGKVVERIWQSQIGKDEPILLLKLKLNKLFPDA